jgi:hypothetical protein
VPINALASRNEVVSHSRDRGACRLSSGAGPHELMKATADPSPSAQDDNALESRFTPVAKAPIVLRRLRPG